MADQAFAIHPDDNVATALGALNPGEVHLIGEKSGQVQLKEPIREGHKVATTKIEAGEQVIKYGVAIGKAVKPIEAGTWVHLHNLVSLYDAQSSSLDLESGAPPEGDHYV